MNTVLFTPCKAKVPSHLMIRYLKVSQTVDWNPKNCTLFSDPVGQLKDQLRLSHTTKTDDRDPLCTVRPLFQSPLEVIQQFFTVSEIRVPFKRHLPPGTALPLAPVSIKFKIKFFD